MEYINMTKCEECEQPSPSRLSTDGGPWLCSRCHSYRYGIPAPNVVFPAPDAALAIEQLEAIDDFMNSLPARRLLRETRREISRRVALLRRGATP